METTTDIRAIQQSNLSAATIKVRDAVIQKCEGKNLDEMTQFIKQLLEHETNEQKRLGVLAARVYLLREKIGFLLDHAFDNDSAANIKKRHGAMQANALEDAPAAQKEAGSQHEDGVSEKHEWQRVKILKDAEVNQVRFLAGVVIDVLTADAQKLIDAGKAEVVASSEAGPEEAGQAEAVAEDQEETAAADQEETASEGDNENTSEGNDQNAADEEADAAGDDDAKS